jgi:ferrochelatase
MIADNSTLQTAHFPADHPKVAFGKIGVLLVNLGTPDGTDYKSMRRYLAEFLSDKRVIEWSRLFWYPILYGIVLNKRPQKVGKAYEEIWNHDLNESYLRTYTRNQGEALGKMLTDLPNVVVDWGMRYGNPSIAERMDALKARQGLRISDEAALATCAAHRAAVP